MILRSLAIAFAIVSNLLNASASAASSQTDTQSARLATIYRRINSNWSYPKDKVTKVQITDSWQELTVNTVKCPTSIAAWDFEKQPSFTKALDEITNGKLVMECSNAARILRMALVHSVLGDEAMLSLARQLNIKHPKSRFNVMSDLSWIFFEAVKEIVGGKFYAVPFVNLPEYGQFKDGADGNHNVLKLPNGLYIGFAPDFFAEPKTNAELERYLFERFTDQNDIIEGKKAEHAQFCTGMSLKKFKAMRADYQAKAGYYTFNPPAK